MVDEHYVRSQKERGLHTTAVGIGGGGTAWDALRVARVYGLTWHVIAYLPSHGLARTGPLGNETDRLCGGKLSARS